ncbi:acyl carrier protein [Streptomyces chartreusis]|uniref:acyl carrier protein n=1 Tax=Streptomyces chartreusis TaxID=1969 RepID=UPI0033AA9802
MSAARGKATDHVTGVCWDETFERLLRDVLPQLAEDMPLHPDSDLQALGLDSLLIVELLMRLEDAYQATLDDEALDHTTFSSPSRLWAVIAPMAADRRGEST